MSLSAAAAADAALVLCEALIGSVSYLLDRSSFALVLVLVVRLGIVNSPFEDEKPLDADDEDDDEDEETLGDPIQSVV